MQLHYSKNPPQNWKRKRLSSIKEETSIKKQKINCKTSIFHKISWIKSQIINRKKDWELPETIAKRNLPCFINTKQQKEALVKKMTTENNLSLSNAYIEGEKSY